MSDEKKFKRKIWSNEETSGFLYCYIAHKEEFSHSRKKIFAYGNVLKDMIAQGYTSPSTTTTVLAAKLHSLLMAYRIAKKTGKTTPCIAPFMDSLKEIFENSSLFSTGLHINMDDTSTKPTNTDASDEDKSQVSLNLQWPESTDEEQLIDLFTPKSENENSNAKQLSEMKRKKKWTKEETLGLLYCYHARQDEFYHKRKKKFAYENVLKDMIDQGFTNSSTTTASLETKMCKLIGAYKTAKETGNKPSVCIAPFMNEMEEIFKDRPISTNSHTTHMNIGPPTKVNKTSESDYSCDDQPENSLHLQQLHQSESVDEEEQLSAGTSPTVHLSSLGPPLHSSDPLSTITLGKRKSDQEIFYENKLKLKREEIRNKKLMRTARHEQREKFMRESLNALQKKWDKDHEVEMKKLELLEKLIQK